MERKIGEIFEYNGTKFRVEKEFNICINCCFRDTGCVKIKHIRGECESIRRSHNDGVIFVKVEDEKEGALKLSLEKAKEFYKKGGEFKDLALSAFSREELTEVKMPKTWEEFCKLHNTQFPYEYIINKDSRIIKILDGYERDVDSDKNIIPSEEAAEAHLALMQLHQLRDYYRQGWKPDWNNGETAKHCILKTNGDYYVHTFYGISSFLSFQSLEIACQFLGNFRNLIIKTGDLI